MFGCSAAPVLAINGSEDTVVDPVNAARIGEGSANPASRQLILEGVDDTFNIFTGNMTAFEQLIDATVNWFAATLQPVDTTEEVSFMNGDRLVPATVVMPVGKGPFPAVVMNHGHGGSRQENGGFGGVVHSYVFISQVAAVLRHCSFDLKRRTLRPAFCLIPYHLSPALKIVFMHICGHNPGPHGLG